MTYKADPEYVTVASEPKKITARDCYAPLNVRNTCGRMFPVWMVGPSVEVTEPFDDPGRSTSVLHS